jgi:drug/metabolite transporter (DMT)-like permease
MKVEGRATRLAREGSRLLDGRVLAALAVTFLLWGSAMPGLRVCLRYYSPGHLAVLRMLAATVAMAAIALLLRVRVPDRRDLPGLALVGFTGVTCFHGFLNHGLITVTAGSASLLVNTAPVYTALLATLFLGERMKVWGWLGFGVSLCGAAMIGLGEGKGVRFDPGAFYLLGSALSWSLNIVLQKPYLRKYSATEVTAYAIFSGTLALLAFAPGLAESVEQIPMGITIGVLYLGVFPIAVAYITWAYVLSRLDASRAASYLYLVPVVAILCGWIGLRETPALLALAGGALALSGVVIVNTQGR